jgi:hypothetical protein
LNAIADATQFGEVFAIKQALSRMEIAHNQFEITADSADLIAFRSWNSRLNGLLFQAASGLGRRKTDVG